MCVCLCVCDSSHSCQCLDTIWMRRRAHMQILTTNSSSKICNGNSKQMTKTEKDRDFKIDLQLRSTGTVLPQRKERGQSSECEQVTESPHSPHHLDTQGQRKMCYIYIGLSGMGRNDLPPKRITAHTQTQVLVYSLHSFTTAINTLLGL